MKPVELLANQGEDAAAGAPPALLSVRNLSTYFFSREGILRAVDGVSFDIAHGEALGIAGESGCGKSVTAQSILRLIPPNGRIVEGEMLYHHDDEVVDLATLNPKGAEIRKLRGKEIAMIFQEPMAGFSMVYTIGNQITEVIQLHQKCSPAEARQRAIQTLHRVGMPKPEQTIDAHPYALSGGMRQRAMIAMALSCHPSLLIADEPTTAVDVTIQAQVVQLLRDLQRDMNMAMMVITHDLAVISELCNRVMIMYLGKDVESGPARSLFSDPKHPYTVGLLKSVPALGRGREQEIAAISGSIPRPYDRPRGCAFHTRCPQFIQDVCNVENPPQVDIGGGRRVRCHLYA